MATRKRRLDKVNSQPRGKTRGPKTQSAKERARQYAEDHPIHEVDPDALALELVPEPGARQELVKRIGKCLLEQNEALRREVIAGSQTAARANNETIRILASLAGLIVVGPKQKPKTGEKEEDEDGPAPEFVGIETDAADDVDLNDALEKQFGPADGSG